jgi:Zn-dependent protease with chaperone function
MPERGRGREGDGAQVMTTRRSKTTEGRSDTGRLRSVLRSWRRLRSPRSDGFEIVPSDSLFAYTLPGRGRVIVSSGLVRTLEPEELAIVLAHEVAHALHRHDRYVLTAELGAALVPFVHPLRRRLLFALERWAEEAAVACVQGDRPKVARTLARVALVDEAVPAAAVGIAWLGVAGRFEALLGQKRFLLPFAQSWNPQWPM